MADSMVSIAADGTISCPQRSGFRRVQTPQVFKLARLLHAHRAVADHAAFTDDLSVMIAAGHSAIRPCGLRRHQSEKLPHPPTSAPRKPLSKAAADAPPRTDRHKICERHRANTRQPAGNGTRAAHSSRPSAALSHGISRQKQDLHHPQPPRRCHRQHAACAGPWPFRSLQRARRRRQDETRGAVLRRYSHHGMRVVQQWCYAPRLRTATTISCSGSRRFSTARSRCRTPTWTPPTVK